MDYFKTLNLEREPFSNSPDPGLFYNSRQHLEALQKLEIAIRLKRGLSVITGDVGTGKTTLSRQLIQKLSHDPALRYFLILDPGFSSTRDFLSGILSHFTGQVPDQPGDGPLKEEIKKYLFTQGVDRQFTTVLMIDEGQKLPVFCLEALRELLNYETNDHKLLQIVIFAQKEFNETLLSLDNFNDRVNFRYDLSPLGFFETRKLIRFRIEKSAGQAAAAPLFLSFPAYIAVYRYTRGFPRKIINLCHHILIRLLIKNKTRADYGFVRACAEEVFLTGRPWKLRLALSSLLCLTFMACGAFLFKTLQTSHLLPPVLQEEKTTAAVIEKPAAPVESPVVETAPPALATGTEETVAPIEAPPETVAPAEAPIEAPALVQVAQALETAPLPEAAPEIEPAETPAKADNSGEIPQPPETYGAFRVPKADTLYRLMEIVYGSYRIEYVEKMMSANPKIKDPNQIIAGMLLQFPVIAGTHSLWENRPFCIRLSAETDFTKAVESVKHYRQRNLDVRMLPVWEDKNGFVFPVVVNQAFESLAQADSHKTQTGMEQGICERIFADTGGRKPL